MQINWGTLRRLVAGLASVVAAATASAADLDWSIDSTVGHTNNATLVDSGEISDTIGSVGGSIDLQREGSRISTRLRGAGSYRTYFDNTYDNDLLGSADAEVRVGLIGDSLTWTLADTFGQVLTDVFEPSTPDNRENVNVLSTGPDLRLRFGSATEVVVKGRFEDASYQDTGTSDNQQYSGTVALVRRTSPVVAWSLNLGATHVEYDAAGNPSYDSQEVFVRLASTGAHQTLTADLGMNFLNGGDQTDQAPLVRVDFSRELTPSWNLELGLLSQFQNADDLFVSGVDGGGEFGEDLGGTQDVRVTNQAFRNDSATLGLRFQRVRTELRVYGNVNHETYPDESSLDREGWTLGAEASRRLTERLRATIYATQTNRTFHDPLETDKTSIVGASLDWRVGKALYLGLSGGTEDRSGDTSSNYQETVYAASISYRPGGERSDEGVGPR